MIKIAVCDDDAEYLKYMKKMIANACVGNKELRDVEYITYHSGKSLTDRYLQDQIDIVFIDIELEQDTVGFDIARQLNRLKRNPAIVYMSSHEEYAAKGYVCRPLGFVRKNHCEEDMLLVMSELLEYVRDYARQIVFYDNSKPVPMFVRDICAIEVFNHELNVIMVDSVVKLRTQMSKYIPELEKNGFVVIRRGIMLNTRYIEEIRESKVYMIYGKCYEISRERIGEVRKQWIYSKLM